MRIFSFLLFLVPTVSFGAGNEFMVAAQLLSAAKNADIQQVQVLINNGANVNYVDSTGLSVVCTALMNNDVRAAQILQMYGADASNCDRQIKQYNSRNKPQRTGGLFGGLSSAQSITLTAAGAAVIVGGLFLLTDWLDPGNGNKSSSSQGSHGNGGGNGGGGSSTLKPAFTLPYGPATLDDEYNYVNNLNFYSPTDTDSIYYKNFKLMTDTYKQNYLLMMRGYSAFARGYMGMTTLRNLTTHEPLLLDGNNLGTEPVLGGRPVNVALVTANGINAAADTSLGDKLLPWTTLNGTGVNPASNDMVSSKYYNNLITLGTNTASLADDTTAEDESLLSLFDLSGNGTAINNTSATNMDNLLAKVVAGSVTTGATADFMGFMPNGQLSIFRTGGGSGFLALSSATNAGTYTVDTNGVLTGLAISDVASGANLNVSVNGNTITAARTYSGSVESGTSGNVLHFDTNADNTADLEYAMVLNDGSAVNGTLQTIPEQVGTYTLNSDGKLATISVSSIASGAELSVALTEDGFVVTDGNTNYSGSVADGVMRLNTGDGIVEYSMTLNYDSQTAGKLKTVAVNMGTYTLDADGVLKTLTISGVASGAKLTVTLNGENIVATDGSETYAGYIGADGLLYFDTGTTGGANVAYEMVDGTLRLTKSLSNMDYSNYRALRLAGALYVNGDTTGGRSRPNIVANASVIEPLHATTTATTDNILALDSDNYKTGFSVLVNNYYNVNSSDDSTSAPAVDAAYFFTHLGSTYSPLVLFSTGAVETDSNYSGYAYMPTFENAAPLIYDNLEHLFASVVAVKQDGTTGTSGTENVAGYSPANKYILSTWANPNNTDGGADNKYYRARMCGIAGTGANGIDPWCFAAYGPTDELAVASAAGAFGAVKSAFSYLTNQQIFALVALTADGAYLGANDDGAAFTKETLASYLQGLYELPNEYQYRVNSGTMEYLDAFKEVFGYGLINVERATTPGKSVYYYNGNDIVSAAGNAYWRAASNTAFRSSSAFGARGATLKTAAFDVLTSVDGELTLPRVWTNEFALGTNSKHGLYMGDVLGELKTRSTDENRVQMGNLGFSLAVSPRAYADSLGGLDNMKLDWQTGNWNVAAEFQRHLTDGVSRFSGMNNPVLGLASNAVMSGAKYDLGNWSFGVRAFSGAITDETLLENDPTIAANYEPARLGFVHGAGANIGWHNKYFAFDTAIGSANETNTVLGAYTNGLFDMGAGRTVYVDSELRVRPTDALTLTARATFARTTTDGVGDMVLGVTPIESNAFAIGADWRNFRFSVAQPLAVRRGALQYAYADYNVVDSDNGKFALDIENAHVAEIDLSADKRELRFSGEYRHNFGPFTDGALGFIYRVNPNNTDEFGNESIFMLKMTHRVGI